MQKLTRSELQQSLKRLKEEGFVASAFDCRVSNDGLEREYLAACHRKALKQAEAEQPRQPEGRPYQGDFASRVTQSDSFDPFTTADADTDAILTGHPDPSAIKRQTEALSRWLGYQCPRDCWMPVATAHALYQSANPDTPIDPSRFSVSLNRFSDMWLCLEYARTNLGASVKVHSEFAPPSHTVQPFEIDLVHPPVTQTPATMSYGIAIG